MKTFTATIAISAPAERVWSLLTDGAGWTSWNTTVDRLEGTIAVGEKVTVFVKVNPGRAFPVKVVEMSAPSRMVWSGGMPLGLFKGERTYTLAPRDGGVEFTMTEVYSGLMAPLITRSIPDLQPAFEEFGVALKRRAESAT